MPINKKSFFRYKLIDQQLRRNKGMSFAELTEAVNEELRLLEDDAISSNERKYTVSERMIRNDIEEMQNIFPVIITKKNGKLFYQNKEDSIDNFNLREEDKRIIELALQTFELYKGTPFFEKFDDVITRIMANSIFRKISKRDNKKFIQIGEMYNNTGQQWLERIYTAIAERNTIKIHYTNYGESSSIRNCSPYLLKEYRNKWYLIGYIHEAKKLEKTLVLKLSRIQKIEDSNELFIDDSKFVADDFFKYSLGVFHMHGVEPIDVQLKITGSIIKLISEDKIHSTQEIISKNKNEMIIKIKVYNTPELKNMILSFGENCEILEPFYLKNEIKDVIIKMQVNYR
jgi:predicted DNA-binding transcriptional regulator YafY